MHNALISENNEQLNYDITAHCWLNDENVILGTKEGDLHVLNNECRWKLKLLEEDKNQYEVTCIICIYKGFIVGYANGRIQIYHENKDAEKKENKRQPYVLTKPLDVTTGDDINLVKIRDMSVSPSSDQENLICLTSTNLIYKIKLEKDQDDIEEPKFDNC